MAFKSQQADIDFLRGHVSQLTQSISQLSLPPSEEEIRAKHWWAVLEEGIDLLRMKRGPSSLPARRIQQAWRPFEALKKHLARCSEG